MLDPDEIIKNLTFDICLVCGWVGLSDEVTDNKCPVCGSEDMDDVDADPYEDD
jgi:rubrerythrin